MLLQIFAVYCLLLMCFRPLILLSKIIILTAIIFPMLSFISLLSKECAFHLLLSMKSLMGFKFESKHAAIPDFLKHKMV